MPLISEVTASPEVVVVTARIYGPATDPGDERDSVLVYGPGDEITRAEADRLGLGSGNLAEGYWAEEPLDAAQRQGHRDTLAAQRLTDIETSTDPAKVAAEASGLAGLAARGGIGSSGASAPSDADLAVAAEARDLEVTPDPAVPADAKAHGSSRRSSRPPVDVPPAKNEG